MKYRSSLMMVLLAAFPVIAADKEADLVAKFKQPKLWTDPAQQQTLNGYLDEVRKTPTNTLLNGLLEHIDYDIYSYPGVRQKMIAPAKQFPVVGILDAKGASAVPLLIDFLKKTDPDDKKGNGERRQGLAIIALQNIYEEGGFGRELARERLKLEIAKSKDKEKDFLQKALKHPFINRPVDASIN
jgi:hypothetical protein